MTELRHIIRIGTPLLAGNLSMYLYRLADTLMVGRLGVEPLAIIAIATIFTSVHEMFIWPVSLGTQALVSRRYGRGAVIGTNGEAGEILPQGLYAGLLAGAGAFVLSLLAPLLLPLISRTIAPGALAYIRIARWGFLMMGAATALRGFLAATHNTGAIMTAVVASNVINVVLNGIFIFGLLGAPAMGVTGAAIGTLGAHGVNLFLLGGYTLLSPRVAAYLRNVSVKPQREQIHRILAIAAPPAIQNAIAMAVILLYQSFLGRLGTVYQGVTHVLFSTFRLNKTLVGGYANGASILVGNALGQNDHALALRVVRSQQGIAAIIGAVVGVVAIAQPSLIGRAFSLSGDALVIANQGFRFFALFFLVEILAYSLEIIFTHNGWGTFVLWSEVITNLIGILGVTYLSVFVFSWGHLGAWAGYALYQTAHAAILWSGLFSRRWLHIDLENPRVR